MEGGAAYDGHTHVVPHAEVALCVPYTESLTGSECSSIPEAVHLDHTHTVFLTSYTIPTNPPPPLPPFQVIEVSKVHFKDTLATAFTDPRLTLLIQDAAVYVQSLIQEDGQIKGGYFDAIICDSSDPVGPANVLFQRNFFNALKNILNPQGGVLCTQGESMWLHLPLIKSTRDTLLELFPCVLYAYSSIPTYPGGGIGYLVSTLSPTLSPPQLPSRPVTGEMRFYSAEVHKSVFVLPSKLCMGMSLDMGVYGCVWVLGCDLADYKVYWHQSE
ncbi:hypothetical protein EON63_16945 [archaeon]|nr:MAG: hypothetical protein EON63_16945 [archaeon]